MLPVFSFLVILFHTAELQAYRSPGYLGCYYDGFEIRILRGNFQKLRRNSGENCKKYCQSGGYRYAGTKDGFGCYCGHSIRKKQLDTGCYERCPGRIDELCGGITQISMHDTWPCATKPCDHGFTCEDIDANSYTCFCMQSDCDKAETTLQPTTPMTTVIQMTQTMEKDTTTIITTNNVGLSTVTKATIANRDRQLTTETNQMSTVYHNTTRKTTKFSTTPITNATVIQKDTDTERERSDTAIVVVPVMLICVAIITTIISIIIVKKRTHEKDNDIYHEYHEPSEPVSNKKTASANVFVKRNNPHIANNGALQSDETYANNEVDAQPVDGSYEMLQYNADKGSEYTTIDLHSACTDKKTYEDDNYDVLNTERQPERLYSEINPI